MSVDTGSIGTSAWETGLLFVLKSVPLSPAVIAEIAGKVVDIMSFDMGVRPTTFTFHVWFSTLPSV